MMPDTQLDRDNPWPGLESFEEDARDFFHGREAETEDLLRRVTDAPLTVLFGKSGLGKTSLLKAGLFPRLREKNLLPILVRLDIRQEAPELGEQLRDGLLAVIARERVDAPPFTPGETLWEYLHRANLEMWNEQNYPLTPVFVLDQFEEVFTLGERLPESVEGCKIDLGDLAENRIPAALASRLAMDPGATQGLDLRRMAYKLVVTLREDFLPHLEGWRAAVPSLGRVRVRLLPMRPEQALSAVYDTAPHLMDEPLARRIVEFVAAAAEGEGGEIEPALLSLFCRGLNERRKKQGSDRFDGQLLEGAQQSIIADYYRSCVEGLPDSVSRFIETDLITEKGFRNSYAKDDAVPAFLTEEQLGQLINRRLLRVEDRYGTARIELTHDLLTRAVMADRDRRRVEEEKAALALRAEEQRQALAVQARTQRRRLVAMAFVALVCLVFAGVAAWQWWAAVNAKKESEKAKTFALGAKTDAERARVTAVQAKTAAERAQTAAEQERDKARIAEDKAKTAETVAQTQARLAKESAAKELIARGSSEARRMETEARLVFDEPYADRGSGLAKATLLSVASVRSGRTVDGQISLTRFLGLLPRAPLWRRSVAQPASGIRQRALAVSPGGARIAVAGESGPVQLLNTRTGEPLGSFEASRNAGMTMVTFSPDGAFLVLGCGPQACIFDVASGQLVARLPSAEVAHGDNVWSASFSRDGQRLAVSSYHSRDVHVYDVATWKTTATIRAGLSTVFAVAFNPEEDSLATAGDEKLQLWPAGTYDESARMIIPDIPGLIRSIAFQPNGLGLIATDNGLYVRQGREAAVSKPINTSHYINVHTVLPVSWRGRMCFVAATDVAVHLLCDASLDEVLRVPVSSAAAAVSPDGRWLFNLQNGGTLAAWPLDAGIDFLRIPLGVPVRSMASTDQSRWLALGTDTGEVVIVDVDVWKERTHLSFPKPAARVHKVTASSDGRWLAVARGMSLHVFDIGTWREVASATYEQEVERIGFDTRDRWLVAVAGTTVVVWRPGDWRQRRLIEHDGEIEDVAVSPDGRQLATFTHWIGGHDDGVRLTRVFDLESEKETGWEYTAASGNISQKFMQDEAARRQRALSAGNTASVREASSWPPLDLKEIPVQTSADGAWFAFPLGSLVVLTDWATNRRIATFDQGGEITSLRFVPTRAPRWLVSSGEDRTLAVWPIRTDDLVREACARLHAIFDPQTLAKLIAEAHAEGSCEGNPLVAKRDEAH